MAAENGFLTQFVDETTFYNRIVLSHLLPANLWEPLPRFLQTWLRSYLTGNLFYFISGFLWCFYIYYLKRNVYIPEEVDFPTADTWRQRMVTQFVDETTFYNRIVLSHLLPANLWEPLPRFLQTWLRSYLTGNLFYFISGFLWCFYIYYLKRNVYIPEDSIPTRKAMIQQILVAVKGMPWYTLFPTVSEYMIERGWTKCYSTLDQFNWFLCFVYIVLYLVIVEFGMYWVHKGLHDIKFLYKHLHATHHIYNKQNTLSPFAGFASHPLDGILQAAPHVIALFIVPVHLITHMSLLFLGGIWTTCIHDCIHGNIWPIMGAGYHTIHHTTYKHNYGQYTICMDWMFATLKVPVAEDNGLHQKAKFD
ncbi:hypothetical protein F2Q68_00002565 [Brassica cretica]|uniref:Fatty acid hydroxylase domain-containing protein n=1 Tax=Brassica cretica TaxID=69181 RepID=A0A8S9J6L1_BRACR|nr:hypothetical protein F2Q68_00002565 [Brassica cretica]